MTKTKYPVSVFKCSKKYMFLLTAVLGLVIAPPLFAEPPPASGQLSFDTPNFQTAEPVITEPTPASVFGNYFGAGKCPPGSPKICTDTGAMDNVFIESFVKPEDDIEQQIRESMGIKKTDARLSIRILRDHGHNCTLKGVMFWSGDHLEFLEKPPYAAKICKLQLWFKDDGMTIKDPGNACDWGYCFDKPATLAGRRFQKGSDQLLAAYKKSAMPPPVSIFGRYNGTGKCATDERKIEACNKNKIADYIVIKPSETADAHVVLEGSNCSMDADVMWLGNHLAFVKERPDEPGSPYILQFWFKDDTVVVSKVWNNHCGTNIQGAIFKKPSASPKRQLNAGKPASPADIEAEWKLVKSKQEWKNNFAIKFEDITKLELKEEAIIALALKKADAMEKELKHHPAFRDFDIWPADAQLGLLSMAWALGTTKLKNGWPSFNAACKKQDFDVAVNHC